MPNDTRDFSQMLEKNESDDKGPKTLSVLKEMLFMQLVMPRGLAVWCPEIGHFLLTAPGTCIDNDV